MNICFLVITITLGVDIMKILLHPLYRSMLFVTSLMLLPAMSNADKKTIFNSSSSPLIAKHTKAKQNKITAPTQEFKHLATNGKISEQVIKAQVAGTLGYRQIEYYDDGSIMRELEWSGGKLNGITRVYLPKQVLLKEIKFKDNQIQEYTAYQKGQVYTKISADRKTIINKGRAVNARWDKYYELLPSRQLVGYTQQGLVDWILLFKKPEDVTQTLADFSAFFDSKAGGLSAKANDIVACGNGKAGIADDLNLSQSALQSNTKKGNGTGFGRSRTSMSGSVQTAINNVTSECGGSGSSKLKGRTGSLGGISARNSQIAQANQAVDQAVASCRASGGKSNDLVSTGFGPGAGFTVFKALEAVQAAEAVAAAAADTAITAATELAVIDGTAVGSAVVDLSAAAATESGAATVAGGFVMIEVIAVVAAAGTGVIVGSLINESAAGQALTNAIADWQEANDEDYQQQAAAAEAAQQAAAERQSSNSSNTQSTAGGTKADAGSRTPDMMGQNKCDYIESFGDFCESTRWTATKCAAFMGIVTGCKVNVTQIQVAGNDGDVFSVGCPSQASDADKNNLNRQIRCEQQGMLARPSLIGGNSQCGGLNQGITPPQIGPNPQQINPVRQ